MYQHVLGTPAFYASGNLTEPLPAHVSCGLAVQKPCLSPAVMIPGKGLVSTLSMSTPVSEIVQGWAFATELPDSAMTDFPPMGIRVGQEVFFTVRARCPPAFIPCNDAHFSVLQTSRWGSMQALVLSADPYLECRLSPQSGHATVQQHDLLT